MTMFSRVAATAAAAEDDDGTPPSDGPDVSIDFTGSNGAQWPPPWTAIYTSGGSAATIQSNRGRLTTGNAGSYNDSIFRGFTPDSQDYEITADFVVVSTANEGYARFGWRSASNGNEYAVGLLLASNEIRVHEQDSSFAQQTKGSQTSLGLTAGTVVHVRIRVEGTSHKVRWWLNAASEPGTWNVEFTDATYTTGQVTAYLIGGNAATSVSIDIDNYTLTYLGAGPPPAPGDNTLPAALASTHGSERTLLFSSRRVIWGFDHFNDELQRYVDSNIAFYNASGTPVSSNGVRVVMTLEDEGTGANPRYPSGATSNYDQNVDPVLPGEYVQARLKCPVGKGFWPAFWLMPQAGGNQFEVDILEQLGLADRFDANYHEDTNGDGNYDINDGETLFVDVTQFFNIGAHLHSNRVDFYLNGTLAWSYPRQVTVPMCTVLNFALGGSYPGWPDATTPFPAVFEVQSVKVWSPTTGGPGANPVVIGLHGYQGGSSQSTGFGSGRDYPVSTGGDVAFTTKTTSGPFPASPSGRAWADDYNATPRYVASEYMGILEAAASGATDIWLHGFSDGGGVCLDILRNGQTFGGRLRGVVLDDPAPALPTNNYANPAGTPVVLYATSPDGTTWNVNTISGFDVLTPIETALGVTRKRSSNFGGPTDHAPMTRLSGSGPFAPPELLDGDNW